MIHFSLLEKKIDSDFFITVCVETMIYDINNLKYDFAATYFMVFPVIWDNFLTETPTETVYWSTSLSRTLPRDTDACCLKGKTRKELWDGKKYKVVDLGWMY